MKDDELEPIEPGDDDLLAAKPLIDDDEEVDPLVPGVIDEPTPVSQLTKEDGLDEEDLLEDEEEEDDMELLGAEDWEE
jgi:hypothetical protein